MTSNNFRTKYPDAPHVSDKNSKGGYMFPDKIMYIEALKFYCFANDVDVDQALDDFEESGVS